MIKQLHNIFSRYFQDSADSMRIANYLPYRIYDEQRDLYYNRDSIGFCLEVTPLCGATEDIISTLTGMITDGIPEDVSIQIINWASPKVEKYFNKWASERQNKPIYSTLAKKRVNFFKQSGFKSIFKNPYLLRDFRIIIAVSVPENSKAQNDIILESLRSQLISTLQSSGMQAWNLTADNFLNFVDEIVNPNMSCDNSKTLKWDNLRYLNEQLINFDLSVKVKANNLLFEQEQKSPVEVRTFSVKEYPEIWSQWLNQDLIGDFYSDYQRLGCPFLQIFTFQYGNEADNENAISFKALRAIQKTNSGLARFDPSIPEKERDLKFVSEKLKNGEKLVRSSYQVLLFSKPEDADGNERLLKSLYKNKGWNLQKDKYLQMQNFLSALPFSFAEGMGKDLEKFGRLRSMVTWTCANIAPLQGEWKGMQEPKMLLYGRRGQPCFWDPFANDNGNYNIAFIGKSGSGKSVAMQELVCSLLSTGGQVVVIDDGRSFMNSCILQEGTFVEFSMEANICLNPFSIVSENTFAKNQDYKEEVLHFINLLIRQMCKETESTTDIENAILETAISQVWLEFRTKGSVSKVAEVLLKQDDPRAKDLGLMLTKFTKKGLYARFFEGEANIQLDQSFYVFEFDRLKSKPDLLKVVVMLTMFLAKEKAFHGDRKNTTSLVIDEAHSLLGGAQGADACEAFARKARKHKAQLITGTQSIDDYFKNPAGNAIVQNTDWFCLLSQNAESVEAMKKSKRILMDANMERALKSLRMVDHQYSEMMVYGGGMGWFIGRLILDPYSIALYSSKGDDFRKIQGYQAKGFALQDAIGKVAENISFKKEARI